MIFPDDNDHYISWERYSSSKIPLHQGHAKEEGNNLCYIKLTIQRQDRDTNIRKQLNSVGQCANVQLFTRFQKGIVVKGNLVDVLQMFTVSSFQVQGGALRGGLKTITSRQWAVEVPNLFCSINQVLLRKRKLPIYSLVLLWCKQECFANTKEFVFMLPLKQSASEQTYGEGVSECSLTVCTLRCLRFRFNGFF